MKKILIGMITIAGSMTTACGIGLVHIPDTLTSQKLVQDMCDALIAPISTNTEIVTWETNINPGTMRPYLSDEDAHWFVPTIDEIERTIASRAVPNAEQKVERVAQNAAGGGVTLRPSGGTRGVREVRDANKDITYEISSVVFQVNSHQREVAGIEVSEKEVRGITVKGKNNFDVYIKYNPNTDVATMTTETSHEEGEVMYKIYHIDGTRVQDLRSLPTFFLYE